MFHHMFSKSHHHIFKELNLNLLLHFNGRCLFVLAVQSLSFYIIPCLPSLTFKFFLCG